MSHFQLSDVLDINRGVDDNLVDEAIWLVAHSTVAILLVLTWRSFADMTQDWIVSIATGKAPFNSYLIFSIEYEGDEDERFDGSDVQTTTVSGIIQLLGFAWGILIITPSLLPLILEVLQENSAIR